MVSQSLVKLTEELVFLRQQTELFSDLLKHLFSLREFLVDIASFSLISSGQLLSLALVFISHSLQVHLMTLAVSLIDHRLITLLRVKC